MNYAIVFRLLGYVMLIEGALLLLPAAASWIYGEWFVLGVFLITAAVSAHRWDTGYRCPEWQQILPAFPRPAGS